MRGRRFLRISALSAATLLLACGDKPGARGTGSGEAAAALRDKDGGADASASAALDAGVDDAAMPQATSEELALRMRHLLEAIVQNNADLAGDIVFPRDAYVASKDAPDPQKAWERKLSNGFRKSVERTHKRTKGIENARFVSFELGHAIVQVTPKKKDFKKPLWRVKHSKLSFTIEGKPRHIDIAEMTAWRGAWYVTRLR
jgi:hypothetical protein